MAKRKTAREKLNGSQPGKLQPMPKHLVSRYGDGLYLIPSPLQVDQLLREIPEGQIATVTEFRRELARRHGGAAACPLCTGIFWRISAEAAEEDRVEGATQVTPYWRLVRDNGSLNEKLPGGRSGQHALLQAEGRHIRNGRADLDGLFHW